MSFICMAILPARGGADPGEYLTERQVGQPQARFRVTLRPPMLPYFELRVIELPGGLRLAVFGTLVALGVFAGVVFAERRARAVGLPAATLHSAIGWALVPGFAFAHALALWPHLGRGEVGLGDWLRFWNGMSSFGGVAGALLGLWLRFRKRPAELLRVAEVLAPAFVVGWVFGRLGCALVHDHVGRLSDFPLAIRFPGGARHDLGLYELIFTLLVLLPAALVLCRRPRPPGTLVAWLALLYAPVRFGLDFLRATDLPGSDVRYAGLTFAQYACVALAGVGIALARRAGRAGAPR
jgi:phosphatidylglycerol:prolipoprotein diacylglycerol transferase